MVELRWLVRPFTEEDWLKIPDEHRYHFHEYHTQCAPALQYRQQIMVPEGRRTPWDEPQGWIARGGSMSAKKRVPGHLDSTMRAKLEAGIAAYEREQRVFVRLLRKRGSFTEREFDDWFMGREYRRPMRFRPLTGETLILGMGINGGNLWAEMLELLQTMMQLDIIDAKKERGLGVVYSLPPISPPPPAPRASGSSRCKRQPPRSST